MASRVYITRSRTRKESRNIFAAVQDRSLFGRQQREFLLPVLLFLHVASMIVGFKFYSSPGVNNWVDFAWTVPKKVRSTGSPPHRGGDGDYGDRADLHEYSTASLEKSARAT